MTPEEAAALVKSLVPPGPAIIVDSEKFCEVLTSALVAIVTRAVAAEKARHGDAMEIIERASRLIKTGTNLGGTGKSLSQLEVAAERERCARVAQDILVEARDTEWDEGVNYAKRRIAAAIRRGEL